MYGGKRGRDFTHPSSNNTNTIPATSKKAKTTTTTALELTASAPSTSTAHSTTIPPPSSSRTATTGNKSANPGGEGHHHELCFKLSLATDSLRELAKLGRGELLGPPTFLGANNRQRISWNLGVFVHDGRASEASASTPPSSSTTATAARPLRVTRGSANKINMPTTTTTTRRMNENGESTERREEDALLSFCLGCVYYASEDETVQWSAVVKTCRMRVCSQLNGVADLLTETDPNVKFGSGTDRTVRLGIFATTIGHLLDPANGYLRDDTIVFKADLTIGSMTDIIPVDQDYFPYFNPEHYSNDIAFVMDDGRRVFANSGILAVHSPTLARMFWPPSSSMLATLEGHQQRQQLQEIPLHDVGHGEFIELLRVIYPSQDEIDESIVEHILKLAYRFRISCVVKKCEKFLVEHWPQHWPLSKRFFLMESYPRLAEFKKACLDSVNTVAKIQELLNSVGYPKLSSTTKETILNSLTFNTYAGGAPQMNGSSVSIRMTNGRRS